MTRYVSFLTLMITWAMLSSCNKYLDVKPTDKFLDDQVYNNQVSIQNALNGVYLNLAKPELYGENLSCTVVDALAQYYNCSETTHKLHTVAAYAYGESEAQAFFSDSWGAAYAAILNLNLFIQKVAVIKTDILDSTTQHLLLGEAYGLRAYISFDMLRLYGPVYKLDVTAAAIPYPVEANSNAQPLLPANKAIEKILGDIEQAMILLENDPVRKQGVVPAGTDLNTTFKERNRRMNYFAVKALAARVQLYAGNKALALANATAVIQEASVWFPWTDPTKFGSDPDRTFSSEVIFGLEDINLYNTYNLWFAATNTTQSSLLIPLYDNGNNVNRLMDIFEQQENDYRYKYCWGVDRSSTLSLRTFYKYADKNNAAVNHYLMPLMRISEMYLVAAECETNADKVTYYMNQLQFNRGLHNLPNGYNLEDELTKAWQKEFWGEGQLFFYYKRINKPSLPSGSDADHEEDMGPAQYVVPLPLSETQFR